MTRLIYWYGAENLEEAYSFYQASKIVSFEKGLEKGKDKLPPAIQKKIDKDKKLTKTEKQIVKGLEQIADDAKLEASERASWLPEWQEDWEDDDNFADENDVADEIEEEEEEDVKPSKKATKRRKSKGKDDASATGKKKKKGKKRKKHDDGTADDNNGGNDDVEKDAAAGDEDQSEDDAAAATAAKKKKKQKTKAQPLEEPPEPVDFQVASDDEKDEDFSDEVSSSSEEEEEYVDPSSTGTKKRKRKDDNEPASGRKKKSSYGPKPKREKKQDGGKKGPKINSKAAEQRYFDECEDIFLPLMRELKFAIGTDDMKTCELCVIKFQRYVGKTTPSFIRIHQFGLAVKDSRKAFKAKGRDDLVSLCHDLTKDLKRIYAEKLPLTPEGFEPKIRRTKKKDASSAKNKRPKVEEAASDDEAEDRKPSMNTKTSGGGEVGQATVVDTSKKSSDGNTEEQTTKAAPAERKAFSLKGMFERPKKAAPPPTKEKVADRATIPAQRPSSATKQIPSWLRGPLPGDIPTAPENEERLLAIESLQGAFSEFPEGKVDVIAASLALESAINDWSTARGDKSDVYWEKTHDIVAALAGSLEPSSFVQEILEGKYETPKDLLRISRKRLNSFAGDYNA